MFSFNSCRDFVVCSLLTVLVVGSAAFGGSKFADAPAKGKGHQMFKWGDVEPLLDELGDKKIVYSNAGMRKIKRAGKAGVHPRIFFGAEDIPEIRKRLKTTESGKEIWLNTMAWVNAMKGPYDVDADYANPKRVWGRYRVPLFRSVGKSLENVGVTWGKLKGGEYVEPGFHWHVFPLEAFRCLIEDDAEGARLAIKVLEVAVKGGQAARAEKDSKDKPYRPVGGHNLSWCYDFLYKWMSGSQRDFFRKEIAYGTDYHAHYGTFIPANAATSNWCTLDSFLPITLMGIYGEEGFNDLKYKGTVRAWKNFLSYGWYESGEGYEGRGKNYQFNDTLVAFARHGDNLPGHAHVKAYGENLLFHAVLSYRDAFFAHDLWGGTNRDPSVPPGKGQWLPNVHDAIGLKWLFPDNKRIDWVYRNAVGEDYSRLPQRPDGYNNAIISALVFAMDYDKDNDDPGKVADGMTFFCPERGLMATRSGWSEDDMFMAMHTRQDLGGHTCADRNSIILSGAGRLWGRESTHNFSSFTNSMVIVDGKEMGHAVPARVVDFVDEAGASFMVGDAKYTWSWMWSGKRNSINEVLKVLETPNDFRYRKDDLEHLNRPFYEKDSWIRVGDTRKSMKQKNWPVKKAFRTAGIVRGKYAYGLVIDDIQRDDKVAHYDWNLQVPRDVAIYKVDGQDILLYGEHANEVVKGEREPKAGEAMLLVRVLQLDQEKVPAEVGYISHDMFYRTQLKQEKKQGENKKNQKTLVVPADSVCPNYKVLLYAYKHGEELPVTKWNKDRSKLEIAWDGQKHVLEFSAGSLGKTDVVIKDASGRFTKTIAKVDGKIEAMVDRDAAEIARMEEIRKAKVAEVKRELGGWVPGSIDGLISHWDFERVENGRTYDGKTGRFGKAEGVTLVEGKVGMAGQFSGAGGVVVPGNLPMMNGPFAVSMWVKAPGKKDGVIFENNGNHGFRLIIHQGRHLRLDTQGKWYYHTSEQHLDDWCHLVLASDGKKLWLYENGVLLVEGPADKKFSAAKQTKIGEKFFGLIDDIRIYKRVLSGDEVGKLYKYQFYISE